MAEIDYSKEMCWRIEEKRPIEIKAFKQRGGYYIEIDAMTMRYETFGDITQSVTFMEILGESYDYINGKANFTATEQGLKELQEKTDIIKINLV